MQKTSLENPVAWWTEEDLAEKETDSMAEPFLSDDTAHNYAIRDLLKLRENGVVTSEQSVKFLHFIINIPIVILLKSSSHRG